MLSAELPDVGLHESMSRYGDFSIHAVLDLRRAFSRAQLERAASATIEAFPVLGSAYEPRFWRDRWRPVESPVSDAVHVVDAPADLEAETSAWARRPIAIARERPMRIVSLPRPQGSRLIVSVSHLAVDGAGAAAVGHMLGSHLYGVRPSAPPDARRDVWSVLERLRWYHWPALAREVVGAVTQPLRTLAASRRERPFSARAVRGAAGWRHLVIAADEVARIKARCGAHGASVNDALVAALARVGAGRSSRGPLAVTYTINLRRYAASPRLTAANTSSFLTAIVPRAKIANLCTTAGAVAAITARHQRGLAGPAFLIAPLALGAALPHAFTRRLTRWLQPLLVELPLGRGLLVTNVGRLDEALGVFGDDLEAVRVIGPTIDGVTCPVVVAYGFRGELHLQLYAPPALATEALEELEAELRDALELPASTPRRRSSRPAEAFT